MVKARQIGFSPNSIKRRLWESPWEWQKPPRPGWEYAGKPRVIWGHEVDARSFSIRTQSAFGIIWTVERQCWAVEQGFFVHRELIRERPVIIGINKYDPTFSYFEPYRAMQEIERRTFQRVSGYGVLLDFIKQQDMYGYTGAWDKRVMCYSPDLQWYKLLKRPMHDMAIKRARAKQHAQEMRDARLVKRARKLIKYGYAPPNTDGLT